MEMNLGLIINNKPYCSPLTLRVVKDQRRQMGRLFPTKIWINGLQLTILFHLFLIIYLALYTLLKSYFSCFVNSPAIWHRFTLSFLQLYLVGTRKLRK